MLVYAEFTREFEPSIFGKAIVWFTDFPASHARLRFVGSDGKMKLFHCIEPGCVVEDYEPGSEIVVASFPCHLKCTLEKFEGIIYGMKDKEYSWIQCVLMAMHIFPKTIINRNNLMVCSELQGVILRDFFDVQLTGNQDQWTPRMNYAALVNHFLERGLHFERYPAWSPRKLVVSKKDDHL